MYGKAAFIYNERDIVGEKERSRRECVYRGQR